MEPWRARLEEGDVEAAWDLFIDRYRRVILATIRRIVGENAADDAFAHVCQALSASELACLKRYLGDSPRQARFSTWLVTVVHNLVVDWLRQREGRRRITTPAGLSPLQQQIFTCVFVELRSHAEAYEVVRASTSTGMSFARFLHELAEIYRVIERVRPRGAMHYFAAPPPFEPADAKDEERLATAEIGGLLSVVLATLADEERAALQLFVVERMPAAEVARTLGWANAKTVYNRVYRALHSVRTALERNGVGREDL